MSSTLHNPHILLLSAGMFFALLGVGVFCFAMAFKAWHTKTIPEDLLNALRNWTGVEPSQSVLAREIDAWLSTTPKGDKP